MKVIVFEGVDGSGKQTQSKLLYDKYKAEGKDVHLISLPNYDSPSSAPVKMYLAGEIVEKASMLDAYSASILFTADRVCTINQMKNKWHENSIIIFDRYTTSNLLHQASKIVDKIEREKFIDWLFNLEFNLLRLPHPDEIFFLNITPEESAALRAGREIKTHEKKDIHESDIKHLDSAYSVGMEIAQKQGWKIIDCVKNGKLREIDDIHSEIIEKLKI